MSGALAQVTERLYADFHTHATLRQVIAVVRRCADEVDTRSQDAVPELVERLARQRLTDPDHDNTCSAAAMTTPRT